MTEPEYSFPTGDTTPFPYETPYPQQVDLMDSILKTLKQHSEKGPPPNRAAILMLESPTGTGKSLSLACAAVAWLRHVEQCDLASTSTMKSQQETNNSPATGLDWLDDFVAPQQLQAEQKMQEGLQRAQVARQSLDNALTSIHSRLKLDLCDGRLRERRENLARSAVTASKMEERKRRRKQGKVTSRPKATSALSNTDFCVEEYHSDDNNAGNDSDSDSEEQENIPLHANGIQSLLEGGLLDGSGVSKRWSRQDRKISEALFSVGSVYPGSGVRKIIYAARTHSQLSQFVGELRRTQWGSNLRVVALGGRQSLCGNHSVKGSGRFINSEATISESCLDMQKGKSSGNKRSQADKHSKGGCPLLSSKSATSTLALHLLSQPSDIEDAARLGEASHTCAYYASRESLTAAEVVVLPYSMLLSKQAREAVGLSLKQSFVIVDEAHNLPEALRSLHLCRLTLPVVESSLAALVAYTNKYSSRLAGRNLYYLGQIRKCLNAFIRHLTKQPSDSAPNAMMSPTELLIQLGLDNINLFKILRYLEHSRLSQKLLGFIHMTAQDSNDENDTPPNESNDAQALSKHVSPLSIVQTFMERLTSTSSDGKVVTDWPRDGSDVRSSHSVRHPTLRYVLLHPAAHFEDIVNDAHAVALVGGTLRPFAHVAAELLTASDIVQDAAQADAKMKSFTTTSSLFSSLNLTAFSCDHVVPSSNVRLACLATGPNNVKLDFRHQSRKNQAVCDEIGRALVEICKVVPHGMVVFLPSYTYEAHLVYRWRTTGLFEKLDKEKKVHREPKSSQQVETALGSYSRDAQSSRGGLLLSVVGGKMSEGINFADDMARCVMVVGLPYPDITDPELKEKMSNMDQRAKSQVSNLVGSSMITGNAYYQNLCMRAVNQSIGRAIRHANDHAAVILADSRYVTDRRIWNGLPEWLRRGAGGGNGASCGSPAFEQVLNSLGGFFEGRKET